jgi:molecular chaperone GrpE
VTRKRHTDPPHPPEAAHAPEPSDPVAGAAHPPDAPSKAPANGPQDYDALFARYQRLAADFENFKRRARLDLADRTQYANEHLLAQLLPLLDNFQRALEQAPAGIDPAWLEGIRLIARQFEDILQAQGVHSIRAVGETFDPNQHEAVGTEESDEHQEGTVVAEVQRGYRLHDRVLRPTLVKIAQPRQLPPSV